MNPSVLRSLLLALSTVTRLSLSPEAYQLLGSPPWVLPNLDCITCAVPFGIGDILRLRIDADLPVTRVELPQGAFELSGELWPESVERVEYLVHSPVPHGNSQSSSYDDNEDGDMWGADWTEVEEGDLGGNTIYPEYSSWA